MKQENPKSQAALSLSSTLQRLGFWLERDGASQIIVAGSSLQQLKKQNRSVSLEVTSRKLHGPRKSVRGRRNYNELHMKLARWPNDAMDENALPFMFCVLSGQADFRIGDYILHCKVGDWVFVPAGVPKPDGSMSHFEGDPAGRQCDVLWIYTGMDKEMGVSCWICRSFGQQHFKEEGASCWIGSRFLAQLFNGLCDEIQHRSSAEVMAYLLRGVLLLMRTEIADDNVLIGGIKLLPERSTLGDPIEEAKDYITTNIWRHLTIQAVAHQVLVSPSTLTRYFRERTGQTFVQFLNEQRVRLASELLRETDLPISIIGEKVGLKYGQLRVLIQKEFDCSPGALRAMQNKGK